MLRSIRSLFKILSRSESNHLLVLFLLIGFYAVLETLGVVSIVPFISLVANPELVTTQKQISFVYTFLGFDSKNSFLVFFGAAVLCFFVFKNIFSVFLVWFQNRFTRNASANLSAKLLSEYSKMRYQDFVRKDISMLYRGVNNDVTMVTATLNQCLVLAAELLVVSFLLSLLLYSAPLLSLLVGVCGAGLTGFVYQIIQKRVSRASVAVQAQSASMIKTVMNTFGGMKDIKITNSEEFFVKKFLKTSIEFSKDIVTLEVMNAIPKAVIETVAFGVIVFVVQWNLLNQSSSHGLLEVVVLYSAAGYRLMPSFHKILNCFILVKRGMPAVQFIIEELSSFGGEGKKSTSDTTPLMPFKFETSLTLNSLSFSYVAGEEVLKNVSLQIQKGMSIGIAGPSGAGKSTLVDVILGLLVSDQGEVRVDGRLVKPFEIQSYQRLFGYVPQSIFLLDDSVTRNIAFGVAEEEIDFDRVKRAAKLAQIDDFIQGLEKGYDTNAGERGVRFSGGQRQRIGIARALYSDPDILILDEATSALDGATEQEFMREISQLKRHKTLVLVAHRLSTLRDCDVLYFMKEGRVVAHGDHQFLFNSVPEYRELCAQMGVTQ